MGEKRTLRVLLRELIVGSSSSQGATPVDRRERRDVPRPATTPPAVQRIAPLRTEAPPAMPRSPSLPAMEVSGGSPTHSAPLIPQPGVGRGTQESQDWEGSRETPAEGAEAQAYLERIREKMERTALDFSRGLLNRAQFEELYAHYQKERASVERFLEMFPHTDVWRSVVTDGFSVAIRRRHQAKVVAYAIYHNETSLPLYIYGSFRLESELVVGMLSGFRSASAEIFGAGLKQTEVEDGKSLYFMPGRHTTLLALYSSQPSPVQIKALEDVHRDFETANAEALAGSAPQPDELVFPHRPVLE
ncbi:MAG: hypothetical protein HYZ68_06195 [Chloroflexi bacterium]|nr:hypothetical protein [Chloroflexota bacterium]